MNIEELLQISTEQLEKMSDAELIEYFKPVLAQCQLSPAQLAEGAKKKPGKRKVQDDVNKTMVKGAQERLAALGFDPALLNGYKG